MASVKILIVENEMIVSAAIASRLKKAGYKITDEVTNAEDAFRSVKQEEPDIIIMDINIDGPKDGIQTAQEIRKIYPVPVVFLTDLDNEKIVQRAALIGADYLVKPFNERQVIASIQRVLHNASQSLTANTDKEEPGEDHYIINNCLFIRCDNNHFKKVLIKEILYIEADGSYANVHAKGEKYTYSLSMNHIFDRMKIPSFVRVSRSHVVNLEKVDEIKGNLLIIDNHEIQIGDKFRSEVIRSFPLLK